MLYFNISFYIIIYYYKLLLLKLLKKKEFQPFIETVTTLDIFDFKPFKKSLNEFE